MDHWPLTSALRNLILVIQIIFGIPKPNFDNPKFKIGNFIHNFHFWSYFWSTKILNWFTKIQNWFTKAQNWFTKIQSDQQKRKIDLQRYKFCQKIEF